MLEIISSFNQISYFLLFVINYFILLYYFILLLFHSVLSSLYSLYLFLQIIFQITASINIVQTMSSAAYFDDLIRIKDLFDLLTARYS